MPERIIIVGAGLAGSRCAQTLRTEGFDGEITLVGEEPHLPYERPALSKEFLAGKRSELALQPATRWATHEIRLLLGTRVEQIDPAAKIARTLVGDLEWDALVLATGARPRRLPHLDGPGVHTLRTLEDARRLRAELIAGRHLTIVGAGFVGAEVASTAAALGLDVTIVDTGRLPFERQLGPEVGRLLADRYRAHGVDLKLSTRVAGLRRDGASVIKRLALDDGTDLATDLVLVAVGAEPAGELLREHGGTQTDEAGRTSLPDVYACGDVAVPWHPALARHLRLEHWTSAAAQAAAVARAILDREPAPTPTQYFWSDQFGLRLQHMGLPQGWTHVVLEGSEDSLAARYLAADGRLVAALLVNRPHDVADLRRQLTPELLAA
jgi:3-phenylpropionate/trans-cinnamate dioxygenase ferredoxin reductase component